MSRIRWRFISLPYSQDVGGRLIVNAATSHPIALAILTSDTKVRLCSPRSIRPT